MRRSLPFYPMLRSTSSILCMASGDRLVWPFSYQLAVGKVTTSLAANFFWVRSFHS